MHFYKRCRVNISENEENMKTRYFLLAVLITFTAFGFADKKAKNFKLPDLQNQQVELDDLLQKGPVVLDFWATWCKPCIKAFPEFEQLYKKYKKQGLTVVGINTDGPRNRAKIKPFVNSFDISFPILIDLNNDVMRQFRVFALPTTLLIAKNGEIISTHAGYSASKLKELDEKLAELLQNADTHK